MNKIVNKGIVLCLILIGISGAGYGIDKFVKWEKQVPDDFVVVKEVGEEEHNKTDFPKDITFQYSLKPDMPVQGDDKWFAYGAIEDGGNHKIYAVEKKDATYRFLSGSKKGYAFDELSFYNLTSLFQMPEQSGQFTVTFSSRKQYKQFVADLNYGEDWRGPFKYYLKQQDSTQTSH